MLLKNIGQLLTKVFTDAFHTVFSLLHYSYGRSRKGHPQGEVYPGPKLSSYQSSRARVTKVLKRECVSLSF